MLCKRCVLPETKPYIWLNENGICNICLEFDKKQAPAGKARLLESELVRVLNKYKSKSKYDCLVMCSGGKDSTSSLYYIKKRYKLNPLVFTFDNGFENTQAIKNVRNAVEVLGVDWLYFKSDFMQEMFSEVVRTKSKFPLCPLCSLWYMQVTYQTAACYDLPVIISGWTQGQLNSLILADCCEAGLQPEKPNAGMKPENEFFLLCEKIPHFIEMIRKKYPKYADFPRNMNEVRKKFAISKKAIMLSPHWFLPYEASEYTELIKKELNWKMTELSYPEGSNNCSLNFLGSYLSLKAYNFTHFHVEMSKLVRMGKLTRQEALDKLRFDPDKEPVSLIISSVLNKLGYTREELC
jgi:hypothetical protein